MLDASTLCRFVDSMLFYLVISDKSSVHLSRPPSKNTSRTLAKTSLGKTLISVLDFGEERRTETFPNTINASQRKPEGKHQMYQVKTLYVN